MRLKDSRTCLGAFGFVFWESVTAEDLFLLGWGRMGPSKSLSLALRPVAFGKVIGVEVEAGGVLFTDSSFFSVISGCWSSLSLSVEYQFSLDIPYFRKLRVFHNVELLHDSSFKSTQASKSILQK